MRWYPHVRMCPRVNRCTALRLALATFRQSNERLATSSINDLHAIGTLDDNDTAANCAALTAIASEATQALATIAVHCKDTHEKLAARLDESVANARNFEGSIESDVTALKASVAEHLNGLRDQVHVAEVKTAEWAKIVGGLSLLLRCDLSDR